MLRILGVEAEDLNRQGARTRAVLGFVERPGLFNPPNTLEALVDLTNSASSTES